MSEGRGGGGGRGGGAGGGRGGGEGGWGGQREVGEIKRGRRGEGEGLGVLLEGG